MDARLGLSLDSLELRFAVSADEEHVTLTATSPHGPLDLGSRSHHYALLTLARARLVDAGDADLPGSSHGWIVQEDLADMLRVTRTQLNLLIFRARKQLEALGVENAQDLVERRRDTNQVRIGVSRLSALRA